MPLTGLSFRLERPLPTLVLEDNGSVRERDLNSPFIKSQFDTAEDISFQLDRCIKIPCPNEGPEHHTEIAQTDHLYRNGRLARLFFFCASPIYVIRMALDLLPDDPFGQFQIGVVCDTYVDVFSDPFVLDAAVDKGVFTYDAVWDHDPPEFIIFYDRVPQSDLFDHPHMATDDFYGIAYSEWLEYQDKDAADDVGEGFLGGKSDDGRKHTGTGKKCCP